MIPTSDTELVERAKRGDNLAFDELWRRYERDVAGVCRGYLGGSAVDPAVDERDLTADTFIRALHALNRYDDRSADGVPFGAWLTQVARRVCLNALSRQRRRGQWISPGDGQLLAEANADPSGRFGAALERRHVLRLAAQAINALPETYRAPFRLFVEGYSHREIAAQLGLRPDAAMKRVERARKLLRPRLADVLAVPDPTPVPAARRSSRVSAADVRAVERALTPVVTDHRILTVVLPTGGELQFCLRVDPRLAGREGEIEARRAAVAGRTRAWKQRLTLAEVCYHSGRWADACEEYGAVLAAYPGCVQAALRLGECLERGERREDAAAVYRRALAGTTGAAAAALRARLAAAEGDDASAVQHYEAAIAIEPREKWYYHGLHACLGRLSRYDEQLRNLARLRALDPRDVFGYDLAYQPCARLGRFDLARSLLERAVEIDPNDLMAVKHLFQARMNFNLRDAETLALAERLVELAPDLVDSWSELAWIYAETGRTEESLAVLQRFLEDHPGSADAHAALAWRYHYLGRAAEEYFHATRAWELAPQSWHACWTYLTACKAVPEAAASGQLDRVAAEIASRFPQDAFMWAIVAQAYWQFGREGPAAEWARGALALNPDSFEARGVLASYFVRFERWAEAAANYEALLRQSGVAVRQRLTLLSDYAYALRCLGDPRADSVLEQALALAHEPEDASRVAAIHRFWGQQQRAGTAPPQ